MVHEHSPLIWWVIGRWFSGLDHHAAEDAYQSGLLVMFRAAQVWHPDGAAKFSTYATRWLRGEIGRTMTDANGRRAHARGERMPDRPLSLDVAPHEDGDLLVDTMPAPDVTDLAAEWSHVVDEVRPSCRDALDHELLDLIAAGDRASQVGELSERHGRARASIKNRRDRVYRLLSSELLERVA